MRSDAIVLKAAREAGQNASRPRSTAYAPKPTGRRSSFAEENDSPHHSFLAANDGTSSLLSLGMLDVLKLAVGTRPIGLVRDPS